MNLNKVIEKETLALVYHDTNRTEPTKIITFTDRTSLKHFFETNNHITEHSYAVFNHETHELLEHNWRREEWKERLFGRYAIWRFT
jgi:hypothetical protein